MPPLPNPKDGEDEETFISRCVSELSDKNEFDSQDQRVAICFQQWEDSKQESKKMDIEELLDCDDIKEWLEEKAKDDSEITEEIYNFIKNLREDSE